MNVIDYGQNSAQQGWQCPLCRVVWAPSVSSCSCTRQQTITAPNTGTTPFPGVTTIPCGGAVTTTPDFPGGWITVNGDMPMYVGSTNGGGGATTATVTYIHPTTDDGDDDGLAGVLVPA